VRQGLRTLLDEQADIHVVGEAADGPEATQVVERLQPDVLVVDIMMGGMNGIEVRSVSGSYHQRPA
jgi:YesN/AraC family two-component response regulator